MAGEGKEYVIGKGRLFFDKFPAGTKTPTGERYFGNTPELSQSIATDTLDHVDSDEGLNIKDESVTIKNDLTLSFKTDNIDVENLALWFTGDLERTTIVAALAVSDPDVEVTRGLFYQLGTSADMPSGTRKVSNVIVSTVVPAVTPTDPPIVTAIATLDGNVDIDLDRARIYIEKDAPDIADGDTLRFTYDQDGVTREIVIGKGKEVRGALRFVSNNPIGGQRDHFWPYAKITSNGDYALKGESWQEMSFNVEVLKRDSATERVYIDGVPA